MTQLYKVVTCKDRQCSQVGQWDTVLHENKTAPQASKLSINGAWFIKQEVENLDDIDTAYMINDRIDFMNDPDNAFLF